MRRAVISWAVVFALLVAGFVASIVAFNSDLYSAHGFVQSYLETLARKDADAALAFPGVVAPTNSDTDLLTDSALGSITDIHFVKETSTTAGNRLVSFSYRLAGRDHQTQFTVAPNGTRLGLFSRWKFVESPLATVSVTVQHESDFSVNAFTDTTGNPDGTAKSFVVFSPGIYVFNHESTYLSATDISLAVSNVGEVDRVTVEVHANINFVLATIDGIHDFLDDCAAQHVLMPTGCPFGESITNRINDFPQWTIVTYPDVSLEPESETGSWLVAHAAGTAHIVVEQKSVFDGSLSPIDKDVPFTSDYTIIIGPNNRLTVSAQFG
jgi:hypothetical protein